MTEHVLQKGSVDEGQLAPLASLADATRAYVEAARSERTRDAYNAQWATFTAWTAEQGLSALPAAPETVALFLTARAQAGRKVSTLALALAAISQAHQLAGHVSPRESALVRETWKGIRRTHGVAPQQKAPLRPSQLRAIIEALPKNTLGARDRALLLAGFTGAFRRSELVAVAVSDLTFLPDGLVVTLRRSKTDQEGRGDKVGLPYAANPATCPVRSMKAWLEQGSITDGAVFRSVDRHGNVGAALSGRDVARIVKRSLSAIGFDPTNYAGHSLRAGLVTAAAIAGKGAHVIMKTSRHRSIAMLNRYIRDAELFRDNAAADLL